jgi:hypothetical protein
MTEHPLAAARGCIYGLTLSATIWAALLTLTWWALP